MTAQPMPMLNEMDELEKRLMRMDFKLQKAKEARDEYVLFLQQKYPQWKPPKMHTYRQPPLPNQFRKRILDDLATSKYYWSLGNYRLTPNIEPDAGNLEPSDPIPTSGGPALEPDLVRIKKRLAEISKDLEKLREHRLYLSTAEYYNSLGPELWASRNLEVTGKVEPKGSSVTQLENLYDLRKQIANIDINVSPESPHPTAEDREWIRAEYLAQKYESDAAKKVTDNIPNDAARDLTKEQLKESRNIPEAQMTGEKVAPVEVSSLHKMLDMLKQKSDQRPAVSEKPTTIASTAAKSRLEKPKSSEKVPAAAPAAKDDGQSFLAKILGTSTTGTDGKPKSTTSSDELSKVIAPKDEDSDSDFFA